ncbi:MAG: glutathione S-transferase [Methylococcaceae bacterium]|nr:glutathione S-transferase [Methylococcaceae bacterium]
MREKHQLIVSLTSPYARKARIAAQLKNLDFEMIVDVPWNDDTGVITLNPLGKVPVWLTPAGEAIYDSRVIVEFLETLAEPELLPDNPLGRIKVKQLEALADGIMDASLCIFAERKKRPNELQYQGWIDRQFEKIHRGLAKLVTLLGDKPYFFGDTLSVADIAVASALGYIGLRFSEDFCWQDQYPELAHFYDALMERPSFKETVPVL